MHGPDHWIGLLGAWLVIWLFIYGIWLLVDAGWRRVQKARE